MEIAFKLIKFGVFGNKFIDNIDVKIIPMVTNKREEAILFFDIVRKSKIL